MDVMGWHLILRSQLHLEHGWGTWLTWGIAEQSKADHRYCLWLLCSESFPSRSAEGKIPDQSHETG